MAFKGVTVYLSRSLVAPESFDALHDALKYNGANICFCSDPSANSPNQYQIISSSDHEKFANLSTKGCNLVGPECVLRCAKEHRSFPKQGYTCCLAMDGVKVLASGFENEEKVKIEKLVTAMCGELQTKTSLDIDFLIAKDVLAAKYKWALNVLRKPVVTIEWLHQCWREHRLVPHEPYRMLPFSGLTICATGIPPDERKQIEGLIIQYGGHYSADLTKKCTHLLCNIAEGAKYKVARRWGHVKILNQKWVSQSISAKACLDEELYPVITLPVDSLSRKQYKEEKDVPSLPGPVTAQSSLSQPLSSIPSNTPVSAKEKSETVNLSAENISENTGCMDGGSQNEENDLYLENCRILLVGFEHVEMRKLVRMVWSGGGSRYMSFNEKLTHIIVGRPSEIEMKEIRKLTMWGVVNAVNPLWLEDCTRSRREVDVSEKHIFSEKTFFHGIESHKRPKMAGSNLSSQEQNSIASSDNSKSGFVFIEKISPLENQSWEACNTESLNTKKASLESNLQSDDAFGQKPVLQEKMDEMKLPNQSEFGCASVQHLNSSVSIMSNVFKGCRFGFSKSFPEILKNEIVAWVHQGGGLLVEDAMNMKVDYIIERHGSRADTVNCSPHATFVSSHWIRYCLEEGSMLDVGSHILYKPVTCQIPLAGFESMRFSVSQYEEKDRILLRNLCYILGAKFTGKLNKKVTHLLCLFAGGPKYEAACSWGIEAITADWIYECVKQNKVLPLNAFRPREMPRDGNACSFDMTQYPAQVAHLASREVPSQWQNDSQPGSKSQIVEVGGEKRERSPLAKKTLFGRKTKKQHHSSNGLLKRVSATIDVGCNSDPWDEQSVQWSQGMEKGCKEHAKSSDVPCERAIKHKEKASQDLAKDPLIDSTVEELARDDDNRLYSVKQPVEACSKNGASNIVTMDEHGQQVGRIEDSEATLDVASAIEDLIAQSELLHNDLRTETVDNRNKISQEYPLVSRFREEPPCTTFRVPKEFSARHENEDENQNISNDVAHKAHDDFSESQMESQVIRYEVENTAKKMLMEKIQTRSMTSVRNEGRGRQINNDLARLLNVVDSGGKQKSKRKS